ncbi:hypothetical protein D9M72_378600 [compost metagenome]
MAGVAKADADSAKTMMLPDRMPGRICGRITRRNTVNGAAPNAWPACSTCGSSFCSDAHTEITMNGIITCVSATMTPVCVKTSFSGASARPSHCSASLIRPLLPIRMAQPSVRTTTEISSGPRMTIRNKPRHGLRMRARMMVSGTPNTIDNSVTASAMPAVRRKISW